MEWIEVTPLPDVCKCCSEEDCYNCDYAGLRWQLSRKDDLECQRKMKIKAIERLQKQIAEIDAELKQLEKAEGK